MTTRRPIQRGLTLVEVLVAVAASAIVLASVVVAVHSQQRAYHGGQRVREAQVSARNALLYIEQKLSMAGFGMDPAFALDFGWYGSGPCPEPMRDGDGRCRRDSTDNSDEIVFYSRNPNYWIPDPTANPGATNRGHVWDIVSFPGTNQVVVQARQGDIFRQGQIYQAVCRGGARYTYVTLAARTPPDGALEADGQATLTLQPVGDGTDPFRRQNVALTFPGCFSSPVPNQARLFQIDRYRLHVRPIALGGGLFEPYLVLDTGVDTNDDGAVTEADEQILADGVEMLQVSYGFADVVQNGADVTLAPVGRTPGTSPILLATGTANRDAGRITLTDFGASGVPVAEAYSKPGFYQYTFGPPLPPERKTNHQGNIRSVTLSVVARSPTPDPDVGGKGALTGASTFQVLNLDHVPGWITSGAEAKGGHDGHERIRFDTTVNLPNMLNRRMLDE